MNTYNHPKDIDNFVSRFLWTTIEPAVSQHISNTPSQFDQSQKPCVKAVLESVKFLYASNVKIQADTLLFDAIVSSQITIDLQSKAGIIQKTKPWRYRVQCKAVLEGGIKDFTIFWIARYGENKAKNPRNTLTNNIIPVIAGTELDDEASRFLSEYCPAALEKPMPVPIEDIIRFNLGLDVIQDKRLSLNFSVYGQICFSGGNIEVYDAKVDMPHEISVKPGTILVDARTPFYRNIGCVKNTLAHEAYHWFRHRVYAAMKSMLREEAVVAYRCTATAGRMAYSNTTPRTDDEWVEWQANKVAPRILMPQSTTQMKIRELMTEYGLTENDIKQDSVIVDIIDSLASFFRVSKQAAKIRMIDLGYEAARRVYKHNKGSVPYTRIIESEDAAKEYNSNPDFRKIIDSDLFIYAEKHFAMNDSRYITIDSDGMYALTDYAKANLAECTLQFTFIRTAPLKQGSCGRVVLYRPVEDCPGSSPGYEQSADNFSMLSNIKGHLNKKVENFRDFHISRSVMKPPFWERAKTLIEARGWNCVVFMEKTLLGEHIFNRIKKGHKSKPDVCTIIAICAGLDLDLFLTKELLSLAGHSFSGTREDSAYLYVITDCRGKTIQERNAFLVNAGVEPLGTRTREADKN